MICETRKAREKDKEDIIAILKQWNMHHIPSPEVEELDLSCFFVATSFGKVIGASGYKILSKNRGKTTLLAILPELQGYEVGKQLQDIRLNAMYEAGVKKVVTNSDDIKTINWYKKHYNYHTVGSLKKLCTFGLKNVDHWTTLEMDLDDFFKNKESKEARRQQYIEKNEPVPLQPYSPLIINTCLTGMIPTKSSTPFVPISTNEIIDDAIKAYDAGARITHIHAHKSDGLPTSDAKEYEKIIIGIRRERPDVICCVSTSGRNVKDVEQRTEVLHITGAGKPDMASLTLGSLNFLSGASVNTIDTVEFLASTMKEKNIKPELEVFDSGMVNLAKYLERHDIISGNKYFNILLGNLNTSSATIQNLSMITESLPENSIWAATGLGQFQLPINVSAIAAGGHVRVGIEDSIYYDYNENIHATNENLIKRVVRISDELQRPIATPQEVRSILDLN